MELKKVSLHLILILIGCFTFTVYADTANVFGTIHDLETNHPLDNANIEVLNTPMGTISDKMGKFDINLEPGNYELRFSIMGYQTQDIEINVEAGETVKMDIAMIPTIYLMQGVVVIQERLIESEESISSTSVQSKNVVQMPGSFTDIYRSIKTLPGVSSNNGMSSEFNVRGGTFDENLVIVNDAQVYRPFHLKEASNGSVAIFNMDLLSKVDLITGGFTARYGDKMSSVMNVQYREGNKEQFKFQVAGSAMHAGLLAEGPSYMGSWILGFRKSYLQYILGLLGEDDAVKVDFYDIQGQLTFEPIPAKKFTFQFIHSKDNFELGPKNQHFQSAYEKQWFTSSSEDMELDHNKADYYNNLFSLSFVNGVGSNLFTKTILSHYVEYENEKRYGTDNWSQIVWDKYYHRYSYYYSDGYEKENLKLKIMTSELNQQVTYRYNAFHELLTGISYKHLNYDYLRDVDESYQWGNSNETYPDTSYFTFENQSLEKINPNSYKANLFIEDNWQISKKVYVNLGMRLDYFDFNREYNISPRINLSYKTDMGIIYRAAWGYYYQSPSYRELKYTHAISSNTLAQRSIHHILGMEWPVDEHWNFKLEGYYKKMDNLISFENQNGHLVYSRSNDSRGYASGAELFINWNYKRLSGWISYSFLVAKEDSIGDNYGYKPRATDQTHTLSLVGNVDLGNSWELRIKFLYGSGFPYTPSTYELVDADRNNWERVIGEPNSARLPIYQRLDIRVGKRFHFSQLDLELYLEMINILNKKNVFAYEWNWNNGNWNQDAIELLPLIPSFGFVLIF